MRQPKHGEVEDTVEKKKQLALTKLAADKKKSKEKTDPKMTDSVLEDLSLQDVINKCKLIP